LQVVDPDPCADGGCLPPGLLDGLVAYWRLDDGAGSTTAHDSSGRGNDGTLFHLDGAWTSGRAAGALEIGHAGWVGVVPSPSIDAITNQITVSAWVYWEGTITTADTWGTALSRQLGTGINQHYHLSLHMDGKPSFWLTTAPTPPATADTVLLVEAATAVPKTTWVHLAGTYDGAEARLYVDGTLAASTPITGNFHPDTTPVILGGNGNDASGVPTELFPGRVDELMLYARALSEAEIADLHAGLLFPATSLDAGTD
jgi:hypothetical protein